MSPMKDFFSFDNDNPGYFHSQIQSAQQIL